MEAKLGTVRGWVLMNNMRCGLFNATGGKMDLDPSAVSNNDTEFTYAVSLVVKGRSSKAKVAFAKAFCLGFAEGRGRGGYVHFQ